MEAILQWIQEFLANPIVVSILAILQSSAFLAILTIVSKTFNSKKVDGTIGKVKEVVGTAVTAVEDMKAKVSVLQEEIKDTKSNEEAVKAILRVFIMNSKATAGTKEQVLKLLQGEEPKIAAEVEAEVEEEQTAAELDEISNLVNQL